MNIEAIRERISGEFLPFAILTSDGREYAVRHPQAVLVAPRTLAVINRDGNIVTLNPLHIVALKDLRPKANGPSKS